MLAAWTVAIAHDHNARGIIPTAIAAILTSCALMAAIWIAYARMSGWAFVMSAAAAVGIVATIFTGLYPRVLVSRPTFANSLTI